MNLQSQQPHSPEQVEMVETLKGLLAIPSIKGPAVLNAPFGDETVRALRYVLDIAESMGFKTCDLDGYAGYVEFGEGDKEIAVLCHLDVVPAGEGWGYDPFVPFVDKGKLFGRGTCDDKGPAIACLYAMKALKDSGYIPPCRIRLILGLDEESGSECMEYYRTKVAFPDYGFTPDAKFPVIFAEKGILQVTIEGPVQGLFPTSDALVLVGAKGGERANMIPAACTLYWIENPQRLPLEGIPAASVTQTAVQGIPGHASMPEYGENAVSKAMAVAQILLKAKKSGHSFVDFYNDSIGTATDGSLLGINYGDSDSGQLTCNTGLLDLTADSVSMTLDIRYPVTASAEAILAQIGKKCGAAGLKITGTRDMPPLFTDKDSDFVRILLEVYNTVTKKDDKPIAIGGGTYARSMPNVVAFGPNFSMEDDVAHQAGEYIRLDDLFRCKEIYQKAMAALAEFAVK